MTLPLTPNTIYAKGITVRSADLMDLQYCVNQHAHGRVTKPYGVDRRSVLGGTWEITGVGGIFDTADGASCNVWFDPPSVGSVIESIEVDVQDTTGSTVTIELLHSQFASDTSVDSAQSAGSGQHTIELLSAVHVVLPQRYFLLVTADGGGSGQRTVYGFRVRYYRPLAGSP